ncbi:MAG: hypothetical protein F4232_04070, partial [Acidimicrobiaceae bacterium]|nr:hypothetical protein [Acidimicrobiaceae bacterium]
MSEAGSVPAVGVVGLGVMGGAMARHIRAAGHDVAGYDIVGSRAEACGVRSAASPAEMAAEVDVVVFSLPSVESLREAS